jgi:CubicO group peptidase (beta-lactamase class C family)
MGSPLAIRSRAAQIACRAGIVAIASTALAVAAASQQAGPRFRADGFQAEDYGMAAGYPPAGGAQSEQKPHLIGSYSRWQAHFTTREIASAGSPSRLKRAPREPEIRYTTGDTTRRLDDYLDQSPVTGLIIARGDRILIERYQYGRRDDDLFQSMSMAKTVLALLVGVAVRDGHIRSIDDPAEAYVPALKGSEYGRTPLKALLQMSSGIRFKHQIAEGGAPAGSDSDLLYRLRNQSLTEALVRFDERAGPPGARFNYTSSDTLALGMVLAGATGKPVADYASEQLWQPLGAESKAIWRINRSGEELTSCCIGATLRDYARLGLMLAHDGRWNGRQIVPRDWLVAATSVAATDRRLRTVSLKRPLGYGYQVWLLNEPGRMFVLRGHRGQEIFVDPQTRTVMVQTAVLPVDQGGQVFDLWRGVLASLR